MVYIRERQWPNKIQIKNAAISGLLLFLGGHSLLAWSQQHVDSSVAALMVTAVPLWMILLEWLGPNKVPPKPLQIMGIILGAAGIIILTGLMSPGGNAITLEPVMAITLLTSSLLWSLGSMRARYTQMPRSSLMGAGLQLASGGVAVLMVSVANGDLRDFEIGAINAELVGLMTYLTVFGSLIAFAAYNWLLTHTSPVLVSTYTFVNPLLAVIVGVLFGNETLTPAIMSSTPLILGAVGLILLSKARNVAHA